MEDGEHLIFARAGTDGVMMRQSTLDLRGRRSLIITRKEAAEALGADPRTITASINDGTIPSVKLGRRVVIPREKFLAMFAENASDHSAH
ncbi:helix-turn-helix domain-containing protein [Microbacterium sp. NPDC058342]|uniref:helix-turn-helix domain-containing protein n=1 Tax=Microbacterium sp. NPDC058342 TaxID=3346454 RepID=UPI00365D439D